MAGSFLPALLWGVGWANIVHGVPIDRHGEYTGTLFTLLKPYALLGGAGDPDALPRPRRDLPQPQTAGAIEERARAIAARVAPVAAVAVTAFLAWTLVNQDGVEVASAVCAAGAVDRARRRRGARRPAAGAGVRRDVRRDRRSCSARCSSTSSRTRWSRAPAPPSASPSTRPPRRSYTLSVMTVVAVLLLPSCCSTRAGPTGSSVAASRPRTSATVRSPMDLLSGARPEGDGGRRRRLRRPPQRPARDATPARLRQRGGADASGRDGRARSGRDRARSSRRRRCSRTSSTRVFLDGATLADVAAVAARGWPP